MEHSTYISISWLYTQSYCEYQIYLEQVMGLEAEPTPAMVLGSNEHQRLEAEFLTEADLEFTLEEALEESKQSAILFFQTSIILKP